MGNRKLPKDVKKSKKLTVNLTIRQNEELRKVAFKEEMSVSEYVRKLILSQL